MSRIKLENKVEQLTNWTLILTGALSSILSIVELVLQNTSIFESVTLMLLGLIAFGLGLERLVSYKKIETTLENMAGGVWLNDWSEVYEAASSLLKLTRSQIRATALGQGKRTGPPKYIESIAEIAQSRKTHHQHFMYRVAIKFNESTTHDRAKRILSRQKVFQEYGVSEMLEMKAIDTEVILDFLIIDDHSLIIAFPHNLRSLQLQSGIKFVNHPQIVKPIRDWFDEIVWSQASDIDFERLRKSTETLD